MEWFEDQLKIDKNLKLLVWCRFRPQLWSVHQAMAAKYPNITLGLLWGNQKPEERDAAKRLLDPRTMPPGPVVVLGTPATGAVGLNLAGAHTVMYLSNDYSLFKRMQSEDRVHRPGQTYPVSYFDVVATGPNGQKTIDHTIMKALRNKKNVAEFTTSAWIQALREE
jgi:SNF2 family DNA or RNA helicase